MKYTQNLDCSNYDCWHQDKARHSILTDQCHDCHIQHLEAKFEMQKKERIAEEKRAADAAAAEGRRLKPKPPTETPMRSEQVKYKPRWSEQKYVEGPYDAAAKRKPFWGDADQCYREGRWGRIKKAMKKSEMPGDGPNGEPIPYADLRLNQPVFLVDSSGDGWSVARFIPEETVTYRHEDGSTEKVIKMAAIIGFTPEAEAAWITGSYIHLDSFIGMPKSLANLRFSSL